ncbi:hypothetical protein [Caballeronia sp. S22]|uniref:hypothetical protein n=1 Tax=Caballeronia sp. S22 TaxID=3137182 RepID=UPI0035309527
MSHQTNNIEYTGDYTVSQMHTVADIENSCNVELGFPGGTPVLVANLKEGVLDFESDKGASKSLTLDVVPLLAGLALKIGFRRGGLLMYWLGDLSDQEISDALDDWCLQGRIPIAYTDGQSCFFESADFTPPLSLYLSWNEASQNTSPNMMQAMSALAAAGLIEVQGIKDAGATEIKAVRTTVLQTKRHYEEIDGKVMTEDDDLSSDDDRQTLH